MVRLQFCGNIHIFIFVSFSIITSGVNYELLISQGAYKEQLYNTEDVNTLCDYFLSLIQKLQQ